MSNWTRIADDAIETAFGPSARLHLLRPWQTARCVAWVEDGFNEDNSHRVVAIAGGVDHGDACRALVQMCYRDDHRPTTQEVAAVLGLSDGRVRQHVMSGLLVPAQAGNERNQARFAAQDIWTLLSDQAIAEQNC